MVLWQIYEAIIVKPIKYISKAFWQLGDVFVINGSIHGLAMIVIPKFVSLSSKAQSGFVYHYALVMIIGFSLILSTFVFYLVDYWYELYLIINYLFTTLGRNNYNIICSRVRFASLWKCKKSKFGNFFICVLFKCFFTFSIWFF